MPVRLSSGECDQRRNIIQAEMEERSLNAMEQLNTLIADDGTQFA